MLRGVLGQPLVEIRSGFEVEKGLAKIVKLVSAQLMESSPYVRWKDAEVFVDHAYQ